MLRASEVLHHEDGSVDLAIGTHRRLRARPAPSATTHAARFATSWSCAGTGTPRKPRAPRRRGQSATARFSRVRHARDDSRRRRARGAHARSEEHTSELQSRQYLVCRLLLEKKKKKI